jgi:hypothetical protein
MKFLTQNTLHFKDNLYHILVLKCKYKSNKDNEIEHNIEQSTPWLGVYFNSFLHLLK